MTVNTNKDDEATKLWKRTYIDTISVDAMLVDEEKDDAATKQWKRADREAFDEIVRILKFPLGLSLAGFVIRNMRRRARNCTNFGFADYLQAYKNAFPEQEKDSYRLQVAINQDYKRSQDQAIELCLRNLTGPGRIVLDYCMFLEPANIPHAVLDHLFGKLQNAADAQADAEEKKDGMRLQQEGIGMDTAVFDVFVDRKCMNLLYRAEADKGNETGEWEEKEKGEREVKAGKVYKSALGKLVMHGVTQDCIRRVAEKQVAAKVAASVEKGDVATAWAAWKMRKLEDTMRAFDACFVESVEEENEKVGTYVKDHEFLSPHLMRVMDEYRAAEQEYDKAVGRRPDVEKGVRAFSSTLWLPDRYIW